MGKNSNDVSESITPNRPDDRLGLIIYYYVLCFLRYFLNYPKIVGQVSRVLKNILTDILYREMCDKQTMLIVLENYAHCLWRTMSIVLKKWTSLWQGDDSQIGSVEFYPKSESNDRLGIKEARRTVAWGQDRSSDYSDVRYLAKVKYPFLGALCFHRIMLSRVSRYR